MSRLRIDLSERNVFELDLHFVHTDSFGEWRVYLHRLERDAFSFVGIAYKLKSSHVVQAVRELDQQDAYVVRRCEKQFAKVFGLEILLGRHFQTRQFGYTVHEALYLGAELTANFLERGQRVLDRVVQQRGDDGRGVQLHIRDDARDF